jgi:hypothetical protein
MDQKNVANMTNQEIWSSLNVDSVMTADGEFESMCDEAERLIGEITSEQRREAEELLRNLQKNDIA